MIKYAWNSKKRFRKVHIIHPEDGKTYCLNEKSNHSLLDVVGYEVPLERQVCSICSHLLKKNRTRSEQTKVKKVKESRIFYLSKEWHKARYEALKLYGATCMLCGAAGKQARIHVDHIKPVNKYPELRLDIKNLQILCRLCNSGKGDWDETDFR